MVRLTYIINMFLTQIKKGGRFRIEKIDAVKKVKERLFQLGIFGGATGEVVKYSLFNANILLKIDGHLIALRTEFANNITVTERTGA